MGGIDKSILATLDDHYQFGKLRRDNPEVDPQDLLAQYAQSTGRDSSPEAIAQMAPNFGVEPSGFDVLVDMFKHTPSTIAKGIGGTGEAVDRLLGLAGVTDPNEATKRAERWQKGIVDPLTPSGVRDLPTSTLGKLGVGLWDFAAEMAPELALSIGTAGATGVTGAVMKGAAKVAGKGAMSKVLPIMAREALVEGPLIGLTTSFKLPKAHEGLTEMHYALASGDTKAYSKGADKLIDGISDEIVLNAVGGAVIAPGLHMLGRGAGKIFSKLKGTQVIGAARSYAESVLSPAALKASEMAKALDISTPEGLKAHITKVTTWANNQQDLVTGTGAEDLKRMVTDFKGSYMATDYLGRIRSSLVENMDHANQLMQIEGPHQDLMRRTRDELIEVYEDLVGKMDEAGMSERADLLENYEYYLKLDYAAKNGDPLAKQLARRLSPEDRARVEMRIGAEGLGPMEFAKASNPTWLDNVLDLQRGTAMHFGGGTWASMKEALGTYVAEAQAKGMSLYQMFSDPMAAIDRDKVYKLMEDLIHKNEGFTHEDPAFYELLGDKEMFDKYAKMALDGVTTDPVELFTPSVHRMHDGKWAIDTTAWDKGVGGNNTTIDGWYRGSSKVTSGIPSFMLGDARDGFRLPFNFFKIINKTFNKPMIVRTLDATIGKMEKAWEATGDKQMAAMQLNGLRLFRTFVDGINDKAPLPGYRNSPKGFFGSGANGMFVSPNSMIYNTDYDAHVLLHEFGHFLHTLVPEEIGLKINKWITEVFRANPVLKAEIIATGGGESWNNSIAEIFAELFRRFAMDDITNGGHIFPKLPEELVDFVGESFYKGKNNAPVPQPVANMMQDIMGMIFNKQQAFKFLEDPKIRAHREKFLSIASDFGNKVEKAKVNEEIANSLEEVVELYNQSHPKNPVSLADAVTLVRTRPQDVRLSAHDLSAGHMAFRLAADVGDLEDLIGNAFYKYIDPVTKDTRHRIVDDFLGGDTRVVDEISGAMAKLQGEDGILTRINSTVPKIQQKAYEELSQLYHYVHDIKAGIYAKEPRLARVHVGFEPSVMSKWLGDLVERYPQLEWIRPVREGTGKVFKWINRGRHLVKKNPRLAPIYNAWMRYTDNTRNIVYKVTRGEMEGIEGWRMNDANIDGYTAKPVVHYLESFKKGGERELMVRKMLLHTNEHANNEGMLSQALKEGRMTDWGAMKATHLAKALGMDMANPKFKDAYEAYLGIRYTLKWMGDRQVDFLERLKGPGDNTLDGMRKAMATRLGYIPQLRKGKFMVRVPGENGESQFMMLTDSKAKALEVARHINSTKTTPEGDALNLLGHVKVEPNDRMPTEAFFGADPTNIQKFIDDALQAMGTKTEAAVLENFDKELTAVLSQQLKNGFALNRTLHRKNVAGWDMENIQDALFQYIQGYAGFMTRHNAMKQSMTGMKFLRKGRDVQEWKWANGLVKDMVAGSHEMNRAFSAARDLVMFRYLGLNISTAMLQLTQNLVMAVPRLTMSGAKRPHKLLLKAFKDVMKVQMGHGKYMGSWETRAMREAEAMGITWANFSEAMTATVETSAAKRGRKRWVDFSMAPMRSVEHLNRRATFLAGYRTERGAVLRRRAEIAAKKVGESWDNAQVREKYLTKIKGDEIEMELVHQEARERAMDIVRDSHLIYEKYDLPAAVRGSNPASALAKQAYLLKSFSHGYIEFFSHMMRNSRTGGAAAMIQSMMWLGALGGAAAVPGFELFDMWAQRYGDKKGTKWLQDNWGKAGDILATGPMALLPPSMRVDIGTRLNATDPRNFASIPLASVGEDFARTFDAFRERDVTKALASLPILPRSVSTIPAKFREHTQGFRASSGKVLNDSKSSFPQFLSHLIGFNPQVEAKVRYINERIKKENAREEKTRVGRALRNTYHSGKAPDQSLLNDFYTVKQRYGWKATPSKVMRAKDMYFNWDD